MSETFVLKLSARRIGRQALIFVLFLALAIVLTWPLASKVATHLPAGTDSLVHYWNGWMVQRSLEAGETPYFTTLLFFPHGLSLVYHNFAWLHIAGWLLLEPLLGGVAAYNVVFLLNLAMCGMAMFWLAREVIGDPRLALLAGVVYQAWPHRLTQPSHPNLMSTWAIPLFILFLVRVVKNRRWQDGLLAGLSLALVGYMRWQLLIGAALVGAIYLLLALSRRLDRRSALILGLAGLVAVIALARPLLLLATEMQRNPMDIVAASDESSVQTDLLAYITPPGSGTLAGDVTTPLYQRYYADRGARSAISPYIGLVTLFLIVVGLWKGARRQTLPWLAMAVVLILLALGPTLRVGGRLFELPMPYDLANFLVVPLLLREPDRFNIFLALPAAMLAALGAQQLGRRWGQGRRYGALLVPILAVLVGLDFLVTPMEVQSMDVSGAYSRLASEPGEFAVLNVPVDPYKSKPYMQAQTVHGRPIVQGHASRYPAGTFDFLENQPWLRSMMQFSDVPPRQNDIGDQLQGLAQVGIGTIVVHKDMLEPSFVAKWRRYLVMKPWYEDDDVLVYTTAPVAGRDFALEPQLAPGLGIINSQVSATCLNPGGPLAVWLAWGSSSPQEQRYTLRLALEPPGTDSAGPGTPAFPDQPPGRMGEDGIVLGDYSWQTPADLAPGEYALTASLLEDDRPVGSTVVLGTVTVQEDRCEFEVSPGIEESNAVFGGLMRLL
ncbi:MAG: hypothetical protein ACK2UH_03450, partial [Candidatus Promineifilaceae bacterium]